MAIILKIQRPLSPNPTPGRALRCLVYNEDHTIEFFHMMTSDQIAAYFGEAPKKYVQVDTLTGGLKLSEAEIVADQAW